MISDLKKMLFLGVKEDYDAFFNRAQKIGLIEFIQGPDKALMNRPRYIEDTINAMKIIKHYPTSDQRFPDDSEANEIVEKILMLQRKIETLQEERIHIQAEIEKISPLGEFSVEDIHRFEQLSGKKMLFFTCKRGFYERSDFPKELIYITTEYDLDYFMYIGEKNLDYGHLIELEFSHPLSMWKERDSKWLENIRLAEKQLKEMATYLEYLRQNLIHHFNHVNLTEAKQLSDEALEGRLFAINGWIPKKHEHEIVQLCHDLGVHFEEVAIEKTDRLPTYIENEDLGRVGEDLVHIYDTPASDDRDPSYWVLFAFTIFFGIIVSDAGYGLIYLLLALFVRFKWYHRVKETGKRFIQLFLMLSTASVIWGVLTCSYFSIEIPPSHPINRYSVLNYLTEKKAQYHLKMRDDVYQEWSTRFPHIQSAQTPREFLENVVVTTKNKTSYPIIKEFEDNILMEFSILIGIIHLSLSLLRYVRRNIAGLGWVIFMIGGYFFFPKILNATTLFNFLGIISKKGGEIIGFQLLLGGLGFAVIAALIQNRLKGLGEIFNSIQIFADVLSYLRLYALGLASMIMAATFNDMGKDVHWALGALITVLGHSVNIVIGIMGGVIHGLRLNFIEWYHYSFEGGGKLFNPLKILKAK